MLDDLLVNEIGSALDDPTMRSYAFATASPGDESANPLSGSPHSVVNQLDAMGHRGSFSGPGQPMSNPNMEHRGSLSVPNPMTGTSSQRNSFSAQGEPMVGPNQLPEVGDTKGVFLHQLPQFDSTVTGQSASEAGGTTAVQTPFAFGVAEIHQRVVESMKSQDEREGVYSPAHGHGGRLEMLLGKDS